MNIDEYAAAMCAVGPEPTNADASDTHLAILALSMVGDAAEVAEIVKRRLRDGTFDRDRLAHELGDVIYYWARLCGAVGILPSEVLERSRKRRAGRVVQGA